MRARLKLFVSDEPAQQNLQAEEPAAAMPLGEFARVVADAVSWDRTWLEDLSDEPVVLSRDLYEIIRLYDEIHRERA